MGRVEAAHVAQRFHELIRGGAAGRASRFLPFAGSAREPRLTLAHFGVETIMGVSVTNHTSSVDNFSGVSYHSA